MIFRHAKAPAQSRRNGRDVRALSCGQATASLLLGDSLEVLLDALRANSEHGCNVVIGESAGSF